MAKMKVKKTLKKKKKKRIKELRVFERMNVYYFEQEYLGNSSSKEGKG